MFSYSYTHILSYITFILLQFLCLSKNNILKITSYLVQRRSICNSLKGCKNSGIEFKKHSCFLRFYHIVQKLSRLREATQGIVNSLTDFVFSSRLICRRKLWDGSIFFPETLSEREWVWLLRCSQPNLIMWPSISPEFWTHS